MPTPLLTVEQAAEYLGLARNTVLRLFTRGIIPATKVSYRHGWRVSREALDAHMALRKRTPRTGPHNPWCMCSACKPRRPRPRKGMVDLHLYIPPELKTRLVVVCKRDGLDMTQVAREALGEWLEGRE